MDGIIRHTDYELEYLKWGHGKKIMFAFHGFNNNAMDFESLGKFLGDTYTIIAINLFFHGGSHAREKLVVKGFTPDDLKNMFLELTERFPAERYTMLGFSLGGRLVFKILELFPTKIEEVILLAPDGIRISPFYRFLTKSAPGQDIFKKSIENPSVFFKIAGFLRKSRLVSEKKFQFAVKNFDTSEKRKKVYLIWMVFRKILSRKKDLQKLIREYRIPVMLFFGKFDQIIPSSIGKKFRKGLEEYVSLNVLEHGHRLLNEKVFQEVAEKIRAKKNDVY